MQHSSSPTHFFGLDIGTSTVRCVVGMFDPHNPNELSVIGHGLAKNLGMRKGVVVHLDELSLKRTGFYRRLSMGNCT